MKYVNANTITNENLLVLKIKLVKILEKTNFVLKNKIICTEPFIGSNYYDMNYIFNDEITETDTLWKYVSNNEYNNLKLKLKIIR